MRTTIPLPITINKFMDFKHFDRNNFKNKWKEIKFQIIKIKGRQLNSTFIKSDSDLNKYFNNSATDISSIKPGKSKKKLGCIFELPDQKEYLLKITTKDIQCKIQITTIHGSSMYCEYILQIFSFLLTS